MFIQSDYKQITGEVKERNRFYKIILEIKEIAMKASISQDAENCQEALKVILDKCEELPYNFNNGDGM